VIVLRQPVDEGPRLVLTAELVLPVAH
jgi:hypothetical protein